MLTARLVERERLLAVSARTFKSALSKVGQDPGFRESKQNRREGSRGRGC